MFKVNYKVNRRNRTSKEHRNINQKDGRYLIHFQFEEGKDICNKKLIPMTEIFQKGDAFKYAN